MQKILIGLCIVLMILTCSDKKGAKEQAPVVTVQHQPKTLNEANVSGKDGYEKSDPMDKEEKMRLPNRYAKKPSMRGMYAGKSGGKGVGRARLTRRQYGALDEAEKKMEDQFAQRLDKNAYYKNTYQGGSGDRDVIEKMIQQGIMVDGKRVKLEAFARSYKQEFDLPKDTAVALYADLERPKITRDGEDTYLQIGIQGIKKDNMTRPKLNIALVLDRSGSMAGDKLENVKKAAEQAVNKMAAIDFFSLVIYDHSADVLIESIRVTDKNALIKKIKEIKEGGSTNIEEGLRTGYTQVLKNYDKDAVNQVILLSDGEANVGISTPEGLGDIAARYFEKGIQTTSVGIGTDFNDQVMITISQEGKGNYHFIKDPEHIASVFKKELDDLSQIVAKGLKIRIELNNKVELLRVLGSPKLTEDEEKRVKTTEKTIDSRLYKEFGIKKDRDKDKEKGVKFFIPNFFMKDSHVILLKVKFPKGLEVNQVATIYLKYKDMVFKRNFEAEKGLKAAYVATKQDSIDSINKMVRKNRLGFEIGEAFVAASYYLSRGNIPKALMVLNEQQTLTLAAGETMKDSDLINDANILGQYLKILKGMNMETASSGVRDYFAKSLNYVGYKMFR